MSIRVWLDNHKIILERIFLNIIITGLAVESGSNSRGFLLKRLRDCHSMSKLVSKLVYCTCDQLW